MNRWFGTQADSDRQASERSSRAARRTIAGLQIPLVLSDEDDEFNDCETSLHLPIVDGTDDGDLSEAGGSAGGENTPQVATMAVSFDKENKDNDAESWKKEVKTKFDSSDVLYWFNTVEAEMKRYGINKQ